MEDRRHEDDNAKVRAIVDDAVAELLLLGMESRDRAVQMMACRSMVRRGAEKFAIDSAWDVDDT